RYLPLAKLPRHPRFEAFDYAVLGADFIFFALSLPFWVRVIIRLNAVPETRINIQENFTIAIAARVFDGRETGRDIDIAHFSHDPLGVMKCVWLSIAITSPCSQSCL